MHAINNDSQWLDRKNTLTNIHYDSIIYISTNNFSYLGYFRNPNTFYRGKAKRGTHFFYRKHVISSLWTVMHVVSDVCYLWFDTILWISGSSSIRIRKITIQAWHSTYHTDIYPWLWRWKWVGEDPQLSIIRMYKAIIWSRVVIYTYYLLI